MPDFDQLDQTVLLARVLWFLPAPARTPYAQRLFELGVRVHPDLATKDVMVTGPAGLGEHRPRSLVDIKSARDGLGAVQEFAPDLYDKMQAATTERQKQQLLADIRARFPDMIGNAEQKLAAEGHL